MPLTENPAALLKPLAKGLIVSSQASAGEPLAHPQVLAAMAASAVQGGAVAVRLEGTESIKTFKALYPTLGVPVIGLIKTALPALLAALDAIYITPTLHEAQQLIAAGVSYIALDATQRPRPQPLQELVNAIREEILASGQAIGLWADCADVNDADHAFAMGFDVVSTTLSGYTRQTSTSPACVTQTPDFKLLSQMLALKAQRAAQTSVVLEGRVWAPWQYRQALALGADAVVVGSALTRLTLMTQRYTQCF
ncbi:MAG: putative N-acetylmannosamine-6-phosphate 2-epimerase [Vampirovibrionales bacterium]|nr:putative N-acetylmannosamine-6-phosphate 2-epimerase [Vampirovibrionales bacterium]